MMNRVKSYYRKNNLNSLDFSCLTKRGIDEELGRILQSAITKAWSSGQNNRKTIAPQWDNVSLSHGAGVSLSKTGSLPYKWLNKTSGSLPTACRDSGFGQAEFEREKWKGKENWVSKPNKSSLECYRPGFWGAVGIERFLFERWIILIYFLRHIGYYVILSFLVENILPSLRSIPQ